MEKESTIKYHNEEITVLWKPHACIHSKRCWKELSDVFKPAERPWVKLDGASADKIKKQIDQCPSGALSYTTSEIKSESTSIQSEQIVEVTKNGPLLVYGNLTIKHSDGTEDKKNKVTAFCRCGQSKNKPFCDGTHAKINFED